MKTVKGQCNTDFCTTCVSLLYRL